MNLRSRFPRRTIRLRLTLIYGGLFLVSGAALLAITYLLVANVTGDRLYVARSPGSVSVISTFPVPPTVGPPALGDPQGPISLQQAELEAQMAQLRAHRQHSAELHQLLLQSGIALAIMAVTSIVLGWIVAGRVLRPLRTITTAARGISATNLHRRISLGGPDDEIKELGDTFDGLLGRLEGSFQSQRQFVANASHELRTPLARQRTLIQVALADPDSDIDALRAALERALASGDQQEQLIEALLTLTRGQSGLLRRAPFDLAVVTEEVLLAREAEAQQRGVQVRPTLSPAAVQGDRRLAERLVANLMDNALRYNLADGQVEVDTGMKDGRAVLSIVNTGPIVPSADVDRLIQPFQRLGTDRTNQGRGLGLGLSIVQAIAQAHDAKLSIHPRPSGGLEVQVAFP